MGHRGRPPPEPCPDQIGLREGNQTKSVLAVQNHGNAGGFAWRLSHQESVLSATGHGQIEGFFHLTKIIKKHRKIWEKFEKTDVIKNMFLRAFENKGLLTFLTMHSSGAWRSGCAPDF